jgi:hypothetical protein
MTNKIAFKSDGHRQRFITAIQSIGKVYDHKVDPEYGAALYILTSSLSTWNIASDYVSRGGINFDDLLKDNDFSGGYVSLIELAGNLFNSQTHVNLVDLYNLDESNFTVALTALQIRRHNWHLGNFLSDDEIIQKVNDILEQ